MDRYQLGLYRALSEHTKGSSESASLAGFDLGNRFVSGCLTSDEKACVHSCEPGTQCVTIKSDKVVYIFPIVNRLGNGFEIMEVGHGGGGGDLYQTHELELPDQSALEGLESLCLERIHDGKVVSRIRDVLAEAFRSRSRTLSLDSYGMKDNYDIPLERLVSILNRGQSGKQDPSKTSASMQSKSAQPLPNIIVRLPS